MSESQIRANLLSIIDILNGYETGLSAAVTDVRRTML